LIVALFVVLGAFEYKTYDKDLSMLDTNNQMTIEEEQIPSPLETLRPPPKMPKAPLLTEL
jgi:hypothetical protein